MLSTVRNNVAVNDENAWPSEWLRGVLGPCILRILDREPTYGYVISQQLTSAGLGTVKGGTLYPLLGRLEKEGLVSVDWRAGEGGPGRKYYTLTAQGRTEAASTAERWRRFAHVITTVLDEEPGTTKETTQ